ncbi:hypothetical protein BGZ88_002590 [Linnemannia elongata]|nr:hypothetical protein BGZ88_002590 [Linnemannia elongata]
MAARRNASIAYQPLSEIGGLMPDVVINYTDIPDPIGLSPLPVPVMLPNPVFLPPPPSGPVAVAAFVFVFFVVVVVVVVVLNHHFKSHTLQLKELVFNYSNRVTSKTILNPTIPK